MEESYRQGTAVYGSTFTSVNYFMLINLRPGYQALPPSPRGNTERTLKKLLKQKNPLKSHFERRRFKKPSVGHIIRQEKNEAWRCITVVPVLRNQRKKNCRLKASLSYTVRSWWWWWGMMECHLHDRREKRPSTACFRLSPRCRCTIN